MINNVSYERFSRRKRSTKWNDEVGDLLGRPECLVRYCGNCFSAPRESPFFRSKTGHHSHKPVHFRPEVLSLPADSCTECVPIVLPIVVFTVSTKKARHVADINSFTTVFIYAKVT